MKTMKNIENYTDKEWEELAALLSDESKGERDLLMRFTEEDSYNTTGKWKELKKMNDNKEINVDKAWENIYSRVKESGKSANIFTGRFRLLNGTFLRIAATLLIVIGLGSAGLYLFRTGTSGNKITIATNSYQMNRQVLLPDGSNIFLNRNTSLSYKAAAGKFDRHVILKGEAFFEITPDATRPFTVDAGEASIKVLGTSFNVISKNNDSAVEVFVKTGKVLLSDNSGIRNLILDPGFVGTMDPKLSEKRENKNPNYLSWNTRQLIYEGETLDVVFHDLKRMYNINIHTSDPLILNQPITTSFNNEPHETIIRIICTTFNLSYKKDGDVYHLGKK
jgi:ferric-dicitrate binding protein FerR (iron transport regulator)